MTSTREIHCPICKKPNTWQPDNPFKPFCSHRCKLIDLGEWANDSRAIPGIPAAPEQLPDEDLET